MIAHYLSKHYDDENLKTDQAAVRFHRTMAEMNKALLYFSDQTSEILRSRDLAVMGFPVQICCRKTNDSQKKGRNG